MTALIRDAQETDIPSMADVLSDWIDETVWMPRIHTRAEDLGFVGVLMTSQKVLAAVEDDVLVGFLAMAESEISALYLAPDARRKGIGAELLRTAQAVSEELSLWCFQANEGAIRFYKRHGFSKIASTQGDNEEGLPDIKMKWSRR